MHSIYWWRTKPETLGLFCKDLISALLFNIYLLKYLYNQVPRSLRSFYLRPLSLYLGYFQTKNNWKGERHLYSNSSHLQLTHCYRKGKGTTMRDINVGTFSTILGQITAGPPFPRAMLILTISNIKIRTYIFVNIAWGEGGQEMNKNYVKPIF